LTWVLICDSVMLSWRQIGFKYGALSDIRQCLEYANKWEGVYVRMKLKAAEEVSFVLRDQFLVSS
jgi:hypothetical protein